MKRTSTAMIKTQDSSPDHFLFVRIHGATLAMGVEIVNAAQFTETMNRYAELYSTRHPDKGLGQIMIERARNLALKLYQATKAIAPYAVRYRC
jgi:hypothetical protein